MSEQEEESIVRHVDPASGLASTRADVGVLLCEVCGEKVEVDTDGNGRLVEVVLPRRTPHCCARPDPRLERVKWRRLEDTDDNLNGGGK